ncbi:histidine kinase [Myroides marinus]|uniref:sensor histidine kinase n=1 Tax=Myroides marinus TaxID=703342 RepID=UPI0007422010|nr:sensor histidine kinase [Myroides marinus]KUF43952.1 histidine kinase [Myroides marinus]
MKTVEVLSKKEEIRLHLFLGLLLIYIRYVHVDYNAPYFVSFTDFSLFNNTTVIIFISIFYFHYLYVMPRVMRKFTWQNVCLGWLASYFLFLGIRALIEQVLTVWIWGQQNYFPGTPVWYYIFDNFYFSLFSIGIATAMYIIIYLIRSLQLNQIIQQEKNEAELRFLKSQINPHFVFNTLNNIYYLVYQKSKQALPAIDKMSQLMRYMTYETSENSIELQKEINYIKDFIDLEKMRIAGDVYLKLDIQINTPNLLIPPLLLLPFIENGFKHGVLTNVTHPFTIQITQIDNTLELYTQNKCNNYNKDETSGVGLSNIQKRLALQFANKHTLIIKEEENIFTCKLTIKL